MEETKVVVIEGNIGSGKTTLGSILEKRFGLKLYEEISKEVTLRMLDDFYHDKKRYAFMLQVYFLNERFKMIKEIFKHGGGFLDRSIYGDKVFASVLREDGEMSENEFHIYLDLIENMLEHAQKPKLLIFLDADVDTCMTRIHKRNRQGEQLIDRGYLVKLETKYKEWLAGYDYSEKIVLDYNKLDIFKDEDEIVKLIESKLK